MAATEALHERSRALRALRVTAICTDFAPCGWLYRGIYDGITRRALRTMLRSSAADLAAIYLRGSAVVDFRVAGLSDIDLTLVLHDSASAEQQEAVSARWRQLVRRYPVLEAQPWILRIRDFRALAQDNPGVRYRLMEAQRSWQLCRGDDVLAGIDEFTEAQRLQALVDDLETRLTYLNGLLALVPPADALQRRRFEYLLYKLVLDLVRLAALGAAPPLRSRGEVRRRLLDGSLAPDLAGPLEPLRQFVRHVARHRLRRLYFAQQTERLRLAGRLLDESLRLLGRCYADPDLLALPGVADQFDHFYTAGRFTPTGARVRLLGAAERDFVELVNEVRRGRADGVHLVLESHGVRVNLANVDPALGNCTVVPVPASARDQ